MATGLNQNCAQVLVVTVAHQVGLVEIRVEALEASEETCGVRSGGWVGVGVGILHMI